MFRPLQRVDSSISIGRIERIYESFKTYDTNILYIWQNLINTNNISSTNITKTRNLSRGFILKAQIFLASIEIFLYYVWQSLIRQLACCPVIQQRWSVWTVFIIFSIRSGMLDKQVLIFKFGEDLSYFVILRYKLRDFIKILMIM